MPPTPRVHDFRNSRPMTITNVTNALPPLPRAGDVLDEGVLAAQLDTTRITAAVYGRNGVGKTTFACQGEGRVCLISIEPSPTGGARSVMHLPNVTVYQARSSEKVLGFAEALKARFSAGQKPFSKVVVDGVTSWNDVILAEILKLDYNTMPAILSIGKVSADQYTERSERLIRYLKPFYELPCDMWIIGQERDHNPPKEKTTTKSGKDYYRPTQSPFMREAHPMAQEGSFFSLGVSDTQAKWIQDASDFVMQLYDEAETVEERTPDVPLADGTVMPGVTSIVATGRRVKRLRCVYHPNYASRFRADYRVTPEYIEAPTPEERYQAFLDVVRGKRTKWGHYNQPQNTV